MKTKGLIVALLVAVTLVWTVPVGAKGKGGKGNGFPRGPWWKHSEIVKKINLTDEQYDQIQAAMVKSRKVIMDLENNADKLDLDLEIVMDAKTFDADKALDLIEKIEGYRAKAMLQKAKMLVEFRKVLSEDQYKQLKTLRGKGKGKRGGGKNGKGKRGSNGQKGGMMGRGGGIHGMQGEGQGPGKKKGCPYMKNTHSSMGPEGSGPPELEIVEESDNTWWK